MLVSGITALLKTMSPMPIDDTSWSDSLLVQVLLFRWVFIFLSLIKYFFHHLPVQDKSQTSKWKFETSNSNIQLLLCHAPNICRCLCSYLGAASSKTIAVGTAVFRTDCWYTFTLGKYLTLVGWHIDHVTLTFLVLRHVFHLFECRRNTSPLPSRRHLVLIADPRVPRYWTQPEWWLLLAAPDIERSSESQHTTCVFLYGVLCRDLCSRYHCVEQITKLLFIL
jgi:hypothetical protein